ncbi:hypothetical protein [Paenibacillus eucommiae]|uniref:Uncharacterized protein n=1 Tax=Paenibacillus eucommiae TaxID=1355755 RepID=A0ABS4J7Z5_9BACL|nr:hypothetical protein [Paenibacillus eucommiae]MBP1995957.1 hypothetical protein [Paenibacillus eucommiae]
MISLGAFILLIISIANTPATDADKAMTTPVETPASMSSSEANKKIGKAMLT